MKTNRSQKASGRSGAKPIAAKSSPVTREGARERILATASRLFTEQGYPTTGINQIISESGTAKASFYQYYPSKGDLASEFLDAYGAEHLELLGGLMKRYPSPPDFVQAWVRILKRLARAHSFYGCQMGNLRAQVADSDEPGSPALQGAVRQLAAKTLERLTNYVNAARDQGTISQDVEPKLAARRLLAAYEGAVQVYRITGTAAALEDMVALSDPIWRGQ